MRTGVPRGWDSKWKLKSRENLAKPPGEDTASTEVQEVHLGAVCTQGQQAALEEQPIPEAAPCQLTPTSVPAESNRRFSQARAQGGPLPAHSMRTEGEK